MAIALNQAFLVTNFPRMRRTYLSSSFIVGLLVVLCALVGLFALAADGPFGLTALFPAFVMVVPFLGTVFDKSNILSKTTPLGKVGDVIKLPDTKKPSLVKGVQAGVTSPAEKREFRTFYYFPEWIRGFNRVLPLPCFNEVLALAELAIKATGNPFEERKHLTTITAKLKATPSGSYWIRWAIAMSTTNRLLAGMRWSQFVDAATSLMRAFKAGPVNQGVFVSPLGHEYRTYWSVPLSVLSAANANGQRADQARMALMNEADYSKNPLMRGFANETDSKIRLVAYDRFWRGVQSALSWYENGESINVSSTDFTLNITSVRTLAGLLAIMPEIEKMWEGLSQSAQIQVLSHLRGYGLESYAKAVGLRVRSRQDEIARQAEFDTAATAPITSAPVTTTLTSTDDEVEVVTETKAQRLARLKAAKAQAKKAAKA